MKRVVKHPRYSQTNYDNDIALVQLDSPVDFKGIFNPVCLPTPKKNFAGDDVRSLIKDNSNRFVMFDRLGHRNWLGDLKGRVSKD